MAETKSESKRGLDPTAKGILAATVLLCALGGLLISSVDRLDAGPPNGGEAEGSSQDSVQSTLDAERAEAARQRLERARSLLGEGRHQAARTALDQLLALDPDHAEALALRGAAAVEQALRTDEDALLEQAIDDLRRATELTPTEPDAHAFLGLALGLDGTDPVADEALAACAKALELDAECAPAYRARGILRTLAARAGDADAAAQATADLDQLLQRAPRDAQALACRSAAYALQGKSYLAWSDAAAALTAVAGLEARLIPGLEPGELRQTLVDEADALPADARGEAARDLATLLASREPETRAMAALALAKLGPASAAALPALLKAIDDEDEGVRLATSDCLARLGERAAEAEAPLLAALDARQEDHVVHALGAVSSSGATLTALVRLLRSEDEFLREAAVQTLGAMGPKARRAATALRSALQRELGRERSQLAFALMAALARILPGGEAIPDLRRGLQHQDPTVRLGAVQALGLLASDFAEAKRAIEGAADDEHELVRQRAEEELAKLR